MDKTISIDEFIRRVDMDGTCSDRNSYNYINCNDCPFGKRGNNECNECNDTPEKSSVYLANKYREKAPKVNLSTDETISVMGEIINQEITHSYTKAEILTIHRALVMALESSLLPDRIEEAIHDALGVL